MAQAISRAGGLALVASAGGRLEPDLEAAGGELIRLPVHSKNPLTVIANAFKLARIVRQRRVSIVHARSRAPAWSAYLAARMTRTPFVTTFHAIYNARSPLKSLYNSVMARGDVIIANSEYTREHVLHKYHVRHADSVVAIPRGADIERFDRAKVSDEAVAAQRAQWGLTPDDPRCVVIAPARLTRWKGQRVLIDAAAIVEARRPGALKVILAGDAQGRTHYLQEVQAAIRAAKLQQTVALPGHVSNMPRAFAASDIAVFPVTEPEAFGRGAVEAQAMGVPVIASNLGGFTETVKEGETGLLIPAGAATALAGALERMLDLSPAERAEMGRQGRDHARALYSTAALQAATIAVYERVLGRDSQPRAENRERQVAL